MEMKVSGMKVEFSGREWELMQIVFSHMYDNFRVFEDERGRRVWRLFGLDFDLRDGQVVNEVLWGLVHGLVRETSLVKGM